MLQSIQVTNPRGESITLNLRNPEQSGFFVRNIDGLGPTKGTINLTEVLSFDGGIYNSARRTFRNIVFDLVFSDASLSIEEIRQKTYRYFPVKESIILTITSDERVSVVTGFVESNDPLIFNKQESAIISVICPSAFLASTTDVEQDLDYSFYPLFEFPFENASLTEKLIEFGDIISNRIVNNIGDVETGALFTIVFEGPASDLAIINDTTVEEFRIDSDTLISLTGDDFLEDDILFVSTVSGNRYIYLYRDAELINIFNTFDITSDWIQLVPGNNTIDFSASLGESSLVPSIEFTPLYEGV